MLPKATNCYEKQQLDNWLIIKDYPKKLKIDYLENNEKSNT